MSRDAWVFPVACTLILVLSVFTGAGLAATSDPVRAAAVQANEEPVASFVYSPEDPEPGETIRLNASASRDPDGEIVTYQWDFDNDGEVDAEGGPNRRIAFPSAGTYTVALTVVDDDGATDTTTRDIVVPGDLRPTARLNASTTELSVGESVTLDATGSQDPDGRIVEWAFDTDGDGEFEETFDSPAELDVSYGQAGTREVSLRVTDNDGHTDTASVTLTIRSSTDGTTAVRTTAGETPGSGVDDPEAPGGGGVLATLDRSLPGGQLTAGLLVGLVGALLIGGGFVVYRRPGLAGPLGDIAQGPVGSVVLGLVLVLLFVVVPIVVIGAAFVTGRGLGAPAGGAVIEVAGMALLATVLLLLALLRFPTEREDGTGVAGVVGSLSVDGFHTLVFGLGFLATALFTVGVASLMLAIDLGFLARIGAWLVVAGAAVIPLTLALAFIMMWRG